ncbi:MAG: glycosyltransferase [Myxococcales bacterium]|nr:glycosyltransferase [Myxococcales bacterium]
MPDHDVTLVIPARNAADTLPDCLRAAKAVLGEEGLRAITVVDDGSTDDTGAIAVALGAHVIRGHGQGPAAARNLGWRAARTPLIWFVDADCVIEAGALRILKHQLREGDVGAVGGSYGNMREDSMIASLIHEEIVERHLRMPNEVNFLATFNVVFRKDVLEQVGGFDEHFLKAQDVELAYRVKEAGWRLGFDARSRVKHFHLSSFWKYLEVQRKQGYWRMWLYLKHPRRMTGDSYSGWMDYVQPPLAMASLGALFCAPWSWLPLGMCVGILSLLQLPMAMRIVRRTKRLRYVSYIPFGMIRAYWRGVGMSHGLVAAGLKSKATPRSQAHPR